MVLGRRAQQGGAADIDILHGVFQIAFWARNRLFEGIEVDRHQVYGGYAVFLHGAHVAVEVAPSQESAVDLGMQGLDAAVKHFRETGVVRYLLHRYTGGTQQFRSTAGGQNIDTQLPSPVPRAGAPG